MNVEDLVLVSLDDHLIEPPHAFVDHMPAALKHRAPRIVEEGGKASWLFEGRRYPSIGLNAVVGRPPEEFGMEPTSYEEMRPGCYDPAARVDDMNANGILASLCFPTFPAFAGTVFNAVADREIALAAVRAYNDWHVHEWCGPHPGRFLPLIMLPLWDVALCVAEVKRMVAHGVHAISFPDSPSSVGLPSLHGDSWDPLWRACADSKVVICTHIGSGLTPPHASPETPIDAWICTFPMSIANSAADWLHAPMWKKFPSLRLALSEGGIGWVPYFLERADFTYEQHRAWTHSSFGDEKPSDVFKRHFITCFIEDGFGVKNLEDVGVDMVTYECDYPHSDCLWPRSPERLQASLRGLPDEVIDKITHRNALREFSFDPLSSLGRQSCTVGALRARAARVDTRPQAGRGGARPTEVHLQRPVTSGDVLRMFSSI